MVIEMTNCRYHKKGVTVPEIVIVGALSCMIMTAAMVMMNRSNRQFKKGNDLISIQQLMDNIIERIRTDVRSLKRVKRSECDKNTFKFVVVKNGEDVTITYKYSKDEKTLYRSEGTETDGVKESNFHGSKQVVSLVFDPKYKNDNEKDENAFDSLDVSMQISSNEYSANKKDSSTLSIACQFYSTCVESLVRVSEL